MIDFRFIDGNTVIGDYTFIGQFTGITNAKIGRFCSIGTNVLIGPGHHNLENISTSTCFYDGDIYNELTKRNLIIGNDVWIGSYSIILRGIKIGDGAVIGAGSVVTKDVPPYAIVAGVPAKIIRYRFEQKAIEKIIETEWWKYDIKKAKQIINKIQLGFSI